MEYLEPRALPAVYTVTGFADGTGSVSPTGVGTFDATTLRAAVLAANASAEDDTIVLGTGTYNLQRFSQPPEDGAVYGDLDIADARAYGNLAIIGNGSTASILNFDRSYGNDRLFEVLSYGDLRLTDLRLQGGRTEADDPNGGAVLIGGYGRLNANRVTFDGHVAYGHGGAIAAYGGSIVLTLVDSTVTGNTSGVFNNGRGGGVAVNSPNGQTTFADTTISGNRAKGPSGGGVDITNAGGLGLTVTGGLISNNRVQTEVRSEINIDLDAYGGGLAVGTDTPVWLTGTTIADNLAYNPNPGYGSSGGSAYGGGVYFDGSGPVELVDSWITGNEARGTDAYGFGRSANAREAFGGGLAFGTGFGPDSRATIRNTTISGNLAYGGWAGVLARGQSSLGGLAYGGGVYARGYGTLLLSNSTVSGNTALGGDARATLYNYGVAGTRGAGVAVGGDGFGGGLFLQLTGGGEAELANTTVTGNTAAAGTGEYFTALVMGSRSPSQEEDGTAAGGGVVSNGTTHAVSRIIAGNTGDGAPDVLGSFTSDGNNLIGNGYGSAFANGISGDIVGSTVAPVDPLLGPLQDYGGPTPTHALLSGSPAINAGSNPEVLDFDQRGTGFDRVQLDQIDIGAFELQDTPPIVTPIPDQTAAEDGPPISLDLTAFFEDAEDGAAGLTYTVTGNTNPSLVTASVNGTDLVLTFAAGRSGSATITVRGTDAEGVFVEDTFLVSVTPAPTDPPPPTPPGTPPTPKPPTPRTFVDLLAVGAGGSLDGVNPAPVKVNNPDGSLRFTLVPYPGFLGAVSVATADFTGDGVDDIVTGAGNLGGPHVKVFDGATGAEIHSFFAYDDFDRGGVFVAAGDVDGDGTPDIITGAGMKGGPHVKVFDFATLSELASFFAFDESRRTGVTVGVVDGLILAGSGAEFADEVRAFDRTGVQVGQSLRPFGGTFFGGVNVTGGYGLIIAEAGEGGGPRLVVTTTAGDPLADFFASSAAQTGGATDGNVTSDGIFAVGSGPGGRSEVWLIASAEGLVLDGFLAFSSDFAGGVFVG